MAMQVILTEDVVGLGDIGECVRVRPGYARNFLIPRGKAIESKSRSAKRVAHQVAQIESKKKKLKTSAEEQAKKMSNVIVEVGLRVGSTGKVFGSVVAKDIVKALSAKGFEFDRRRVILEEPIKKIGTHQVKVKLHADVVAEVQVVVNAIDAKEQEEALVQEIAQS